MADDHRPGPIKNGPNGPGGNDAPILDLAFDSGTLDRVRAAVRAYAARAGLSETRVQDVVLAVHELAANAVRHGAGAGAGRLRMWKLGGALHGQVDDGDPQERPLAAALTSTTSWPRKPGHGLWVVQQVADRTRVWSGARGTRATVTFHLRRAQGFRPA
jgi:anti-sigma regulatory factor (Ser/Thr protein kinase)